MPPGQPRGVCLVCLAELAGADWFELKPGDVGFVADKPEAVRTSAGVDGAGSAGKRRFGNYELIEEVARGGMGIVYKATQLGLGRVVAVKMIRDGVLASELDLARFRAEANAAAALRHPNIIRIHEVGEVEQRWYFSMDYVEGRNLAEHLRVNPWPADRAARCLETIAEAIQHAHERGIVHRDLKPSNVIMDETGEPHLTDFGLATRIDGTVGLTLSGVVLGTPSYMAPEQAEGRRAEVGPRSDVYALGAILYEAVTGRPPFRGETALDTIAMVQRAEPLSPRRLNPRVPRDLETICLKCLRKEPDRRYASAGAVAAELRRFLAGEPIEANPTTSWELARRWVRRNPWPIGVASLMLIAGSALVWVGVERRWSSRLRLALEEEARARSNEADAKAAAERAAKVAEKATEEARMALHASRRAHYLHRIILAKQAWREGEPLTTSRLLEDCPPDLRHWEWGYLSRLVRMSSPSFHLPTNRIVRLSFCDDGERVATVDNGGTLRVLGTATGEEVFRGVDIAGWVRAAVLSSDGHAVAVVSEVTTGVGTQVRGVLQVWDLRRKQKIWESVIPGDEVPDADAMRLDVGRGWLIAAWRSLVRRWSLDDPGASPEQWQIPHSDPPGGSKEQVLLDRDGKLVAWAGGELNRLRDADDPDKGVRLLTVYDWKTARTVYPLASLERPVLTIAFSPNGGQIAGGRQDGSIVVLNLHEHQEQESWRGHRGAVRAVAWSSDGTRLASGGEDQVVRVWATRDSSKVHEFSGHTESVRAIAFADQDRRLSSIDEQGAVHRWDLGQPGDGTPISVEVSAGALAFVDNERVALPSGVILSVEGGRESVGFAKGGSYARVAAEVHQGWVGLDQRVYRLKDLGTGPVFSGWTNGQVQAAGVTCAAFDPQGRWVAQLGRDASHGRIVEIRSLPEGEQVGWLPWPGKTNTVHDLAFHRSGDWIAVAAGNSTFNGMSSAGMPGVVTVWDWRHQEVVATLKTRRFLPWASAFSPDGGLLATAGGFYMEGASVRDRVRIHGEIQVWDTRTWEEKFDLSGVTDNVFSGAFTPDGRRLVGALGKFKSRTGYGAVKLWEMESGSEVLSLDGVEAPVMSVAVSPDGKRIAALGSRVLRVWTAQ